MAGGSSPAPWRGHTGAIVHGMLVRDGHDPEPYGGPQVYRTWEARDRPYHYLVRIDDPDGQWWVLDDDTSVGHPEWLPAWDYVEAAIEEVQTLLAPLPEVRPAQVAAMEARTETLDVCFTSHRHDVLARLDRLERLVSALYHGDSWPSAAPPQAADLLRAGRAVRRFAGETPPARDDIPF